MSSLSLEIDQTLERLDPISASRLEHLVRELIALVDKNSAVDSQNPPVQDLRFPLVHGAKPITSEEVAKLEDA
jgi:hypothetical protein